MHEEEAETEPRSVFTADARHTASKPHVEPKGSDDQRPRGKAGQSIILPAWCVDVIHNLNLTPQRNIGQALKWAGRAITMDYVPALVLPTEFEGTGCPRTKRHSAQLLSSQPTIDEILASFRAG